MFLLTVDFQIEMAGFLFFILLTIVVKNPIVKYTYENVAFFIGALSPLLKAQ